MEGCFERSLSRSFRGESEECPGRGGAKEREDMVWHAHTSLQEELCDRTRALGLPELLSCVLHLTVTSEQCAGLVARPTHA